MPTCLTSAMKSSSQTDSYSDQQFNDPEEKLKQQLNHKFRNDATNNHTADNKTIKKSFEYCINIAIDLEL